jgi:hypothetical protein
MPNNVSRNPDGSVNLTRADGSVLVLSPGDAISIGAAVAPVGSPAASASPSREVVDAQHKAFQSVTGCPAPAFLDAWTRGLITDRSDRAWKMYDKAVEIVDAYSRV